MQENELLLDKQIKRKKMADDVVNNPVYVEAFTAIKAELYQAFAATSWKDTAERDEIWRKQQAVDWLENYMKQIMDTGKLAEHTLASKIKKRFGIS